jgi:hypothetical protein
LTLWDLLEASTSGTLCASSFGTSTIWGYSSSSPCTTMSFNGSWRTCSISSTILLPRVSRQIAIESLERAYIPTSPRNKFLEPPCYPWLLPYSKKTMCLVRNKKCFHLSELRIKWLPKSSFSFIRMANSMAPPDLTIYYE